MAAVTIELPNFVKLRTATQRRYVVVWTHNGAAHIERRSDSEIIARREWSKHNDSRDDDGRWERWYVVDTVTKRTIAQNGAAQ